ncbi:hypothetical protein P2318_29140 [Myxococcaceae bacterium GXIMD 01537]
MSEQTNFCFGRSYHCELLDEFPGTASALRHFFPENMAGGQDGLLVRVIPEGGEPWDGLFAFGKLTSAGISRLLSLPDPEKLCVISRGAGYVVMARAPRTWEPIGVMPIIDARPVPSAGVVVFTNFTEMVAYGAEGIRWRTKRLAWDGLRVVEVTDRSIIGEYWDLREETTQRFEVDLATGAQRGGVEG